jgi:hypothetical protein
MARLRRAAFVKERRFLFELSALRSQRPNRRGDLEIAGSFRNGKRASGS